MSYLSSVADLLNDAKHVAEANGNVLLSYLIGMALLHVKHEQESHDQAA